MPDFKVGDRVRTTGGVQPGSAGKVVALGSKALVFPGTEDEYSATIDGTFAYIEMTHGPGARKPWGYLFEDVADLEHID